MSRISVLDTVRAGSRRRGFTLTEVMIATSLAAILLAAVLAAYLFLGRNLTRLVNLQEQEVGSRKALRYFTTDLSAASALTAATASNLTLTKATGGADVTIAYVYDAGAGTLTRTEAGAAQTLLTGLTAFRFVCYNEGGAVTSGTQSVKAVEFAYTSASGSEASGTRASFTSVSPRVVLRNKAVLQ